MSLRRRSTASGTAGPTLRVGDWERDDAMTAILHSVADETAMTDTVELILPESAARTLGILITEACVFASPDQLRPVLASVLFESVNGNLRMVATDSYVLGIFDTHTGVAPLSRCVSAPELLAIGKALAKVGDKSTGPGRDEYRPTTLVTFGQASLIVRTSTWEMSAPVVDAQFPNYAQLLPADFESPTHDTDGAPALNIAMVAATFGKLTLAGGKGSRKANNGVTVKMATHGPLKPVSFSASSPHATFSGLIMPIRQNY